MDSLEKLMNLCQRYINREFGIAEFQSRLEKVFWPDRFKNTLEKKQHNAVNKLEEIQFCYLPENQYKLARQVAEYLWQETKFHIRKE